MAKSITYVGLDVHKDTIAVALAEAGLRGEVRERGKIPNSPAALKALAMKLASGGKDLRFCYEAGPCGYGIQRQLAGMGHDCAVVAPSLIPRKPGVRIKTDRRDATNLAKLHRAGELTPVWVPDQAHEAIRDLVRARQAAVRTLRQARQQLSGFLLRHGYHYHRPAWTQSHRRWLASLKFEQPVHHIVLEDCIAAVEAATARRDRLEAHIEAALPEWLSRRWCKHCKPYAAWVWWPRPHWWLSLATSPASPIPANSWRFSGWCRPSIPAAARDARAALPRPATEQRDDADRSGLELPISRTDQPRATVASGAPGQADPRHCMEGARAIVPTLSKARPCWKAADGDHCRDRA